MLILIFFIIPHTAVYNRLIRNTNGLKIDCLFQLESIRFIEIHTFECRDVYYWRCHSQNNKDIENKATDLAVVPNMTFILLEHTFDRSLCFVLKIAFHQWTKIARMHVLVN